MRGDCEDRETNLNVQARSTLLCCLTEPETVAPLRTESGDRIRKIERAFRKFDLNGDGFLSWEEFIQVRLRQLVLSL